MDTRKLATATLFGVVIAAVKSPFTFPITDYLIIVEVPILALSYLLLGRGGATFTGLVNGVIQSAVKATFFPYDLVFAVSYGILVDVFCTLFKVRPEQKTHTLRLVGALGVASTVLGVSIAYAFLTLNLSASLGLGGYSYDALLEVVYVPILVWGILSGALGGFISARIWEHNLKPLFKSSVTPAT